MLLPGSALVSPSPTSKALAHLVLQHWNLAEPSTPNFQELKDSPKPQEKKGSYTKPSAEPKLWSQVTPGSVFPVGEETLAIMLKEFLQNLSGIKLSSCHQMPKAAVLTDLRQEQVKAIKLSTDISKYPRKKNGVISVPGLHLVIRAALWSNPQALFSSLQASGQAVRISCSHSQNLYSPRLKMKN